MTGDQAERLLARLSNLTSLRSIYEAIRDLDHYETAEPDALPFQAARLVLQDFAWRLEGLQTDVESPLSGWATVAQEIAPHIHEVLEAYRSGDDTDLFNGLKGLAQSWASLRGRLR